MNINQRLEAAARQASELKRKLKEEAEEQHQSALAQSHEQQLRCEEEDNSHRSRLIHEVFLQTKDAKLPVPTAIRRAQETIRSKRV